MNTRLALQLAEQHQSRLRRQPVPVLGPALSPRAMWQEATARASQARRSTGWALVEVGLKLAVRAEGEAGVRGSRTPA